MAVVKVKFAKDKKAAKDNIRYIQHRREIGGKTITRELFGHDGSMERLQAYEMVDSAQKGTRLFKFVISPDAKTEDTKKDLYLNELTRQMIVSLEKRLQQQIPFAATIHTNTDDRHVHAVALIKGRLNTNDLAFLRNIATEISLFQRKELDLVNAMAQGQEKAKHQQFSRTIQNHTKGQTRHIEQQLPNSFQNHPKEQHVQKNVQKILSRRGTQNQKNYRCPCGRENCQLHKDKKHGLRLELGLER